MFARDSEREICRTGAAVDGYRRAGSGICLGEEVKLRTRVAKLRVGWLDGLEAREGLGG